MFAKGVLELTNAGSECVHYEQDQNSGRLEERNCVCNGDERFTVDFDLRTHLM